jgi:hypothetical protein
MNFISVKMRCRQSVVRKTSAKGDDGAERGMGECVRRKICKWRTARDQTKETSVISSKYIRALGFLRY